MLQHDFQKLNARYAKDVVAASSTRGVCLLVVSRTEHRGRAAFIHHEGIPVPLVKRYASEIYACDPHIGEAIALSRNETSANVVRFDDFARIQKTGALVASLNRYWSILHDGNIRETAARVRQVSDNLYLLVGLLSDAFPRTIQIDRAAATIGHWLDECQHHLLEYCAQSVFFLGETKPDPIHSNHLLSAREKDVTQSLFQGLSNKQISGELSMSEYTVENHLRRIYKKFNVHNRTALIAKLQNF